MVLESCWSRLRSIKVGNTGQHKVVLSVSDVSCQGAMHAQRLQQAEAKGLLEQTEVTKANNRRLQEAVGLCSK